MIVSSGSSTASSTPFITSVPVVLPVAILITALFFCEELLEYKVLISWEVSDLL